MSKWRDILLLCLWLLAGLPSAAQPVDPSPAFPYVEHEGQLQLQLNTRKLPASRPGGPPVNNGLAGFRATDRIFIRRLRPVWRVWVAPGVHLDTEFEVEPDPEAFKIETLDLVLNLDFDENTRLSLGRYKVPFGWEGLRSSRTINTIERSDATVFLYPERDVGVMLSHRIPDLAEVSVGSFLGQPRSNGDANGSVEVIGRAVFPLPHGLRIGASGHVGSFRPNGGNRDIPVRRVATEIQWQHQRLKFEAEALWSDGYNTASRADTRAFGYYTTAVYQLDKSLELVVSYDRFDPDLDRLHTTSGANAVNDRDRRVVGLNYYFSREPVHRLMLNYEDRHSLEGPGQDVSGFRLRYQLAW